MNPLWIHPEAEAEAEVDTAAACYEGKRAGLGSEFRQGLEAALIQISISPQAFALASDKGVRKHRLPRFPYTVYYFEQDRLIGIIAVAHQKRRPGYWASRVPDLTGGD